MATEYGKRGVSRKHPLKPLSLEAQQEIARIKRTRQSLRMEARRKHFNEITARFGGELRRIRRSIALVLARKNWRKP